MNELALFAGSGGGILGGKLLGWRTVCAVERDGYARDVLVSRQNDGCLDPFPIWDDVCTFDGKPWRGLVDVVSGGFPCQDISSAGRGAGIGGARSGLWKEMARIIGEVRPAYVWVENSPLLVSRGLGLVLADLAAMGFSAQWGIVGAMHAGAPHRRERIWVMGSNLSNAEHNGRHGNGADESKRQREEMGRCEQPRRNGSNGHVAEANTVGELADANLCRRFHGQAEIIAAKRGINAQRKSIASGEDVADTSSAQNHSIRRNHQPGRNAVGRKEQTSQQDIRQTDNNGSGRCGEIRHAAIAGLPNGTEKPMGQPGENAESKRSDWWATEPELGRVANGVACRVDRLRCIGNGQVPAVVELAWQTLGVTEDENAKLTDAR
jgi:DNA (cytosine-5)-methyltransferase 1